MSSCDSPRPGDVSLKKSLAFTAIKSEYLGRFRPSEQISPETNRWVPLSNFGDGDCGAGEIHTRARKFEETRREGSAENSITIAHC